MAHVLLVEDDPDTSETVRDMLEFLGHQVTQAANGLEALAEASHLRPDVVLTDLLMPEMDGIEVMVEFGERFQGVPILAMSAQHEAPYLPTAHLLGARAVLAKPFGLEALRSAITTALHSNP
ncbi:MAG: response regulator [Acidobacteria bacterium]|nr:response regulator [Acidobacteriota bacterium]